MDGITDHGPTYCGCLFSRKNKNKKTNKQKNNFNKTKHLSLNFPSKQCMVHTTVHIVQCILITLKREKHKGCEDLYGYLTIYDGYLSLIKNILQPTELQSWPKIVGTLAHNCTLFQSSLSLPTPTFQCCISVNAMSKPHLMSQIYWPRL